MKPLSIVNIPYKEFKPNATDILKMLLQMPSHNFFPRLARIAK